ncbi:MAG: Xaa-Pro peptidase family protein [Pseudomonadota bacterium]
MTSPKHLAFTPDEYAARLASAREGMDDANLDALILFRQESLYYLTGFDTFGYVYVQALVLHRDGRMVLLTRAPDRRQAHFTSVIEDVRVWVDGADADPMRDLKAILSDMGLQGCRLGIEFAAYGLDARMGQRLREALEGFATFEDASERVTRQRLVKSEAELDYVRKAAALCDDAWVAAQKEARPGAFEGDILAAMHGAIFRGGGDDPANEFIIGSGPGALMCRYYSGRRYLDAQDQLTLEFAGTYRHYHACMMRTICLGEVPPRQRAMWEAAQAALTACEDALTPGRTAGDVFAAHASVFDDAGFGAHRLNACGYSLGTTFAPNWMDWPMLYADNPVELQPGMVFFMHMILFDSEAGLAASLGRTSLVAPGGAQPLSQASLDLTTVA